LSRFTSKGFFPRLYNVIEAAFRQGDVNHITGDVHFLTILLKKQKTILTIHDVGFMENPSSLKRFILKLFWLTLPVHKCRYITTVSQTTKDNVLQYISFPSENIFVIPVFVSEAFKPSSKEFNKDYPRILQIGTAPNKNLPRLAEALAGIPCKLVIIGTISDSQKQVLEQYKIDYETLKELSEEEVVRQYQLADIVTLISTLEGFGMPIVEANCVERAVITSNISSMPEVAGNAALLTNPFDIQVMRKDIVSLIENDNLRNILIENGRENRKRFQGEAVAQSYVELYQKIVDGI
jgi:glycosyltransferase involved in cell wall biosynthesis